MKFVIAYCICVFLVSLSAPQLVFAADYATAVRKNELSAISQLADSATEIDTKGVNGKTALMIAAKAGEFQLVSKLLDLGANPNATNINGGTPIMFACIAGNIDIIELLISSGADVNARGSNGWGALMVASAKGHKLATSRLIQAGADINAFDIYRWTPLQRATFENRADIVKILLDQKELRIDHRDDLGATALHYAAKKGLAELVKLLVKHGADPTITDSQGRTAKIYAQTGGHEELAKVLSTNMDQIN